MKPVPSVAPRRLSRSPLAAAALGLLAAADAAQSTIRVPSDQPTIQAGIDSAAPGDIVLIEPGQYPVNGLTTLGKELTLRGESGAAQTVLDGGLAGNILTVQNGEGADLVIEGLTFFRGLSSPALGGALDVSGNAAPTIVDCVFDRNARSVSGNTAAVRIVGDAGASFVGTEFLENEDLPILFATSQALALTDCAFRANSFGSSGVEVQNGGSLSIEACAFEDNTGQTVIDDNQGGATSVAIVNSTFRDNVGAVTLNQSGSVLVDGCLVENKDASGPAAMRITGVATDLTVRGTRFVGNVSSATPGALQTSDLNSLLVEDCDFEGNQTLIGAVEGGAAALASTGPGLVRRCTFVGNSSGKGAGALLLLGNTRVENCVFQSNVAAGAGGAVLCLTPSNEIDHCTFVDNQAGVGGALAATVPLSIRSSIFWSNTPDGIDGLGATLDVAYCLVEGGYPGAGNLDADPLFVQAGTSAFHLSLASPCRDAGAPGAPLPATDIEGDPRLIDGAVDIGADEVLQQPYVGTDEDLVLVTLVDGGGNPVDAVKEPLPGSMLTVRLDSPSGTFAGSTYMLLAEFAPTGAALPPAVIPGLDLNPFSSQFLILFDSASVLPFFGGLQLGEAGFGVDLAVPGGLAGLSLHVQGVAFGPGAVNGAYAISNAHEAVLP